MLDSPDQLFDIFLGLVSMLDSPDQLFEVVFAVFADWADEIIGEVLADVFISTDVAAPYCLAFDGGPHLFGLGLDLVLVIFVGAGWHV